MAIQNRYAQLPPINEISQGHKKMKSIYPLNA